MELELVMARTAPIGGTEVTHSEVQEFRTRQLQDMGIKDLPGGIFGVGRNDEGIVIKLVRPIFSMEEQISDVDKDFQLIENGVTSYFGA